MSAVHLTIDQRTLCAITENLQARRCLRRQLRIVRGCLKKIGLSFSTETSYNEGNPICGYFQTATERKLCCQKPGSAWNGRYDCMKRVLAVFLTCVFVLGLLPLPAFALETDSGGFCPHHTEHSYEVCGYMEAVESQPCGHVHDGECGYVPVGPGQPCGYDCHLPGAGDARRAPRCGGCYRRQPYRGRGPACRHRRGAGGADGRGGRRAGYFPLSSRCVRAGGAG